MKPLRPLAAACALLLASCSKAPARPAAAPAGPAAAPVLLFLGDSLTAGYGVAPEEAFPALIGKELEKRGSRLKVRNAGVSGQTSAGLLESLDWSLTPDVKLAFLCVGANDGLRGLSPQRAQANIEAAVRKLRAKGVPAALAGMKVPSNYGADYSRRFEAVYPAVAARYKLKRMPFLLEGVAGRPELNQADGIHPNAEGHKTIAKNVLEFLDKEKVLP